MSRTMILLPGVALCSTEPFDALHRKFELARELMHEENGTGNALGPPLVRTELVFDSQEPGPAAVNPLSVVAIYACPEDV